MVFAVGIIWLISCQGEKKLSSYPMLRFYPALKTNLDFPIPYSMMLKAKLFNRDNIQKLLDVFEAKTPKLVVRFVLIGLNELKLFFQQAFAGLVRS